MRVACPRWSLLTLVVLAAPLALSAQMARKAPRGGARPAADAAPAQLPLKFVGPPTTASITARDLMSRLYRFADDSMMGRLAGTAWNDKGTDYIASELKRLGLEPAGDSGTYFQHPLMKREVTSESALSVGATSYTLWTDFVPRDQGPGTRDFDGAMAVFGGMFGDTASYLPRGQSAGKVVVVKTGLGREGKPDHNVINRFQLTQRYADAAAIVVASVDYMPEGYIAAAFKNGGVAVKTEPDMTARPAYFYVTRAAAQAMLGVPLDSVKTGQAGVAVQGRVRVSESTAPGRNVIAILRGSDPVLRHQYVAIGSHNDHIGFDNEPVDHDSTYAFMRVAAPQGADNDRPNPTAADWVRINTLKDSMRAAHPARLDSIYNGADDDGSGSMSVLEIAERFAGASVRPKRSLLFVWHVAEELGLFGSEYFTDHPTVPRDSIVGQLNMDMVGRGRATDFTGVTKDGAAIHGGPGYVQLVGSRRLSTELGDLIERVNTTKRAGLRFDYSLDADGHPQNIYCRSDHYEYARYGIPVVFMTTGGHADYHQVTDEPQYINYDRMSQIANFVHSAATEIANLGHRLVVDKPKPDPKGQCKQ
jgi:Peptidase family M28